MDGDFSGAVSETRRVPTGASAGGDPTLRGDWCAGTGRDWRALFGAGEPTGDVSVEEPGVEGRDMSVMIPCRAPVLLEL